MNSELLAVVLAAFAGLVLGTDGTTARLRRIAAPTAGAMTEASAAVLTSASSDTAGSARMRAPTADRFADQRRGGWGRVSRRQAVALRAELTEMLGALVTELKAGAAPRPALAAAAADLPQLRTLSSAAATPGGSVPSALLQISAAPGGALAGRVAAAWVVADQTGCGLARPLARLHHAVHIEEHLRQEVLAQLAGPRVTARLLAALPLVGVALGVGLGADPVGFLVGTPVGLGCTAVGLTLIATGMWWTSRITASVAATYCADP